MEREAYSNHSDHGNDVCEVKVFGTCQVLLWVIWECPGSRAAKNSTEVVFKHGSSSASEESFC